MNTNVKIVVVGDNKVRKSCFLHSLLNANFNFDSDYHPSAFSNHTEVYMDQGNSIAVKWYDTTGEEDYPRLRRLNYEETSLFLVCFDFCSKDSLQNVEQVWLPDTRFCPNAKVMLVGLKTDDLPTVSMEEVHSVVTQNDLPFVEYSLPTREGKEELIRNILAVIRSPVQSESFWSTSPSISPRKSSCKCSIM